MACSFSPSRKVHEFHSHGIAAGLANFLHPRPHHLALGCDQHQFIVIGDRERADDIAGLFSGLHRDDAFAAAGLFPVIIKRRPFADPVFTRNQQHRRRIRRSRWQQRDLFSPAEFPKHRPCCVPDRATVLRENGDSFLLW